MQMEQPLDHIFIDTSVFQQECFFKETGRVSKLLKLAKAGYLRILQPFITEKEWLEHFREQAELNVKSRDLERKLALLGQNEAASSIPIVVRMARNGSDRGQDPGVEIVDIDFRPLQSSLDDEAD